MDSFTSLGASRLKRKIEQFWAKRGKFPDVRIEIMGLDSKNKPICALRSDMINGLPNASQNQEDPTR